MADPLSIASAAAGALSLTLQLYDSVSAIAKLYKSYNTVNEQLTELQNNLGGIGGILRRLDDTLRLPEAESGLCEASDRKQLESSLEFLRRPLTSLRRALDEVDLALHRYDIDVRGEACGRGLDEKKSRSKMMTKLSWVLSGKAELEELVKKMEREKQTLAMAVGIGVLGETTALHSSVAKNAETAADDAALTRKVLRSGFDERRYHETEISERLARIEELLSDKNIKSPAPTIEPREEKNDVRKEDLLRLEIMMQQLMLAQAQSTKIGEKESARTIRLLTVALIVLAIPSPCLGLVTFFIGMNQGIGGGGIRSLGNGGSIIGVGNDIGGTNSGVLQNCVRY